MSDILDIPSFGALPGWANRAVTRKALQAAHDAAAALSPPGLVYLPAGGWWVDGPVLADATSVEFAGNGRDCTSLSLSGDRFGAPLVIGHARRPLGTSLDPSHLPDAFGVLDSSAASAAGQRFGFRSGSSHRLLQWGPLSQGPPGGWPSLTALTIDAAVDTSRYPGDGGNAGIWRVCDRPTVDLQPIELAAINTSWALRFIASDGQTRDFRVPLKAAPLVRVTYQVDFSGGRVAAWTDGTLAGTWPLPAGLSLIGNDQGAPARLVDFGDLTLYGLRIVSGAPYAVGPVGSPQARRDAHPLNDASRYGWTDSGDALVAWLPLGSTANALPEATADVIASAMLQCGTSMPGGWGPVLISPTAPLVPVQAMTTNQTVWGLTLRGAGTGPGLAVRHATHTIVRDCRLVGGAYGLETWNETPIYVLRLNGTDLQGSIAGLAAHLATLNVTEANVVPGRWGLRLWQCRADLDRIFMHDGVPESAIIGSNQLRAGLVEVDSEDGAHPSHAVIDWTAAYTESTLSGVVQIGCLRSTVGPGAVAVDLHQAIGRKGPALVQLDAVELQMATGAMPAVVRTDGDAWQGHVNVPGLPSSVPVVVGPSAAAILANGATGLPGPKGDPGPPGKDATLPDTLLVKIVPAPSSQVAGALKP